MAGNDRERELMDDKEALEEVCRIGREIDRDPDVRSEKIRLVPGAGVQKVSNHEVSVPARKLPRRWIVWCRWVKCQMVGNPWRGWRVHGRYETQAAAETARAHLVHAKGDSWEFCVTNVKKPAS